MIFLLGNCKLVITIILSLVFIYIPDASNLWIDPGLPEDKSLVSFKLWILIVVSLCTNDVPGQP